jgi:acyl-CoA synthetase (AMP-forming)/AMP-acid ligase II
MPLFHVHGLVASTLSTLATGGTVVLPSRFHPLSFWRVARQYGATWYSAAPSLHQLLLTRHQSKRDSRAAPLRFIRSCSAPLSPQLMLALEDAFEAPVVEAYGMTEAAHQVTSNPLPPGRRQPGSVGPPVDVAVRIIDEDGRDVPAGVHGEVALRGPNVIRAYEHNPEANAASFIDGWFRTGDQGCLDDRGYLRLVGRIKELINRGGEKIAPREIDEVLLAHPAIAEAVSFGVPHPTWGETVAAVVVPRAPVSEANLISFCGTRLADFKCPTRVHVADEIPRTQNGKILRRVVAAEYATGARSRPPAAS